MHLELKQCFLTLAMCLFYRKQADGRVGTCYCYKSDRREKNSNNELNISASYGMGSMIDLDMLDGPLIAISHTRCSDVFKMPLEIGRNWRSRRLLPIGNGGDRSNMSRAVPLKTPSAWHSGCYRTMQADWVALLRHVAHLFRTESQ